MKLYLGRHYLMGAAHYVCEDYALCGEHPAPFLIVSDGCSSASDTAVGARILATMARKVLMHNLTDSVTPFLTYQEFGDRVIGGARIIAEAMGVEPGVLHATLLVAYLQEHTVHVYVYGDGGIFLLGHGGQVRYLDISFSNNMPYYLYYWEEAKLHSAYSMIGGGETLEIRQTDLAEPERRHFQSPVEFSFSLDDYSAIALASDGCTQFLNTRSRGKLPLDEVAARLMHFDTQREAFVREHLHEVREAYAKQGIYPLDDVAFAVMVAEENES